MSTVNPTEVESLWFLNSSCLCTIIRSGHGAISMKLKHILDKLNVWRDSAVITKQTSRWEYCFPLLVLLYVIRCDILPPPRCPAAERLKQPIHHSFTHFISTGGPYCSQWQIQIEIFLQTFFRRFTWNRSLYSSIVHHSAKANKHVFTCQNKLIRVFARLCLACSVIYPSAGF